MSYEPGYLLFRQRTVRQGHNSGQPAETPQLGGKATGWSRTNGQVAYLGEGGIHAPFFN